MVKMVTRDQWGARSPEFVVRGDLNDESTCHWNGPTIILNGKTTWDHSKCAGLVRGIQNFHMDGRGWSDIAYNFVECPHGYTFQGRGFNVVNGANGTTDGNKSSHAICCLAGEGNPFSETEKIGFREAVKYISDHTSAPNECKGHRDHKTTECPGDERYRWVHAGMPLKNSPGPTPDPTPEVDEMNDFLYKLDNSNAVWLVAGNMMTKRWIKNTTELKGTQALLRINKIGDKIHVFDDANELGIALKAIPAVGPVPEGYSGPRV